MASVLLIKGKTENPKKWYQDVMKCGAQWEYDDILESYHIGNVYITEHDDCVVFEDMSEEEFFAWETSSWLNAAGDKELIYGYYGDDNGCAEFVHIKSGKCIRDYREYDFEIDTNEGDVPRFSSLPDAAKYIDDILMRYAK